MLADPLALRIAHDTPRPDSDPAPIPFTAGPGPAPDFDDQLRVARATALRTLHRIADSIDHPLLDSSHHDIREARLASLAILRLKPEHEPPASTPPSQREAEGSGRPRSARPDPVGGHCPPPREGAGGRKPNDRATGSGFVTPPSRAHPRPPFRAGSDSANARPP